jgi:UDP-glucose 4-epimerase
MRVLVTGGAGFIGSHLVDAYCRSGHDVCVVDDLSTGRRAFVNPRATFHQVDLLSPATDGIFAAFKPEIVNHHAAQASVKIGASDPGRDLAVNAGGAARIATLSADHGCRKMIYVSSGGTVYGDPEALPIAEDHPKRPISNYGLSKYMGELGVEMVSRTRGLDYTILRYGNAFGPRQDPLGEAGVVSIFAGRLLKGEVCTIDGDGEQRKDYVFVSDLVRANILAHERGSRRVYNIAAGTGVTVNAIFEMLKSAIDPSARPRLGPPRPGDVRNFWLDASRARAELGWTPAVTFADGIRKTAAWLRSDEALESQISTE